MSLGLPGVVAVRNRPMLNPASITGLRVWLDANDPATIQYEGGSNTNIQVWLDKSGHGNSASAASTIRPTYSQSSINGRNSILLSPGTVSSAVYSSPPPQSCFLTLPNFETTSNSRSWFAVFQAISSGVIVGNYKRQYGSYTSIETNAIIAVEDATMDFDNTGYSRELPFTTETTIQGIMVDSAGTSATFSGGRNGDVTTVLRTGLTAFPAQDNNAIPHIGIYAEFYSASSSFYSAPFSGRIAEIICYNRALSVSERQRVEGYLAHKWGCSASLPIGHPFKNSPP